MAKFALLCAHYGSCFGHGVVVGAVTVLLFHSGLVNG